MQTIHVVVASDRRDFEDEGARDWVLTQDPERALDLAERWQEVGWEEVSVWRVHDGPDWEALLVLEQQHGFEWWALAPSEAAAEREVIRAASNRTVLVLPVVGL